MSEDPTRKLYRYIYGNWFTMVTRTYAELDIATRLHKAPSTASELARVTGTNEEALTLLLRCAEEMGFHQREPQSGRLTLTETGKLLSENTPANLKAAAILNGSDYRYEPWGKLPEFVRTGTGEGLSPTWETGSLPFLSGHPEKLAQFQQAMRDLSQSGLAGTNENESIAKTVDFSPFHRIVDVGGGTGSLAAAIARRYPACEVTLMDLEEVLSELPSHHGREELRLKLHHGNFFEEIPSGFNAYLFKNILHNHRPEKLQTIFTRLGDALRKSPPNARAYFFELIREDDKPGRSRNALLNLNLNLLVGGRVRSKDEYADLLAKQGMRIVSIQDIPQTSRKAVEVGLSD